MTRTVTERVESIAILMATELPPTITGQALPVHGSESGCWFLASVSGPWTVFDNVRTNTQTR